MALLENTVEINGQTINKERFGMASINDDCKTFTGYVLFTSQKAKQGYSKSVEENFEDTAMTADGYVVWKSNGSIPFADMLLDFVQIDAIDMDTAKRSIVHRQKDDSNFWKEYGLPVRGDESGTTTKNEAVRRAFERRDLMKASIVEEDNDWFEDGSCFDEV